MKVRRILAGLGVAAVMLVPATPAIAQYNGTTPPTVQASDTETPEVAGRKQTRGVAVTGADVLGMLGIGGVAVVGGLAIRRSARGRNKA